MSLWAAFCAFFHSRTLARDSGESMSATERGVGSANLPAAASQPGGATPMDEEGRPDPRWAGPAIGAGTVNAFIRRLYGAVPHVQHLIRADVPDSERHRVVLERQVTVVDLHNLNDRAKRFVVGVVLRKTFADKERAGQARPLQLVVLDELNKYAPRDGSSPIKEILLDVAERGRSLGMEDLGAGGRMVGLVSHVPELRSRISTQLEVSKGRTGSSVRAALGDH